MYIDLLKSHIRSESASKPSLLRERYQAPLGSAPLPPIVIDEVQKCQLLLDEVHWLIGNTPRRFLLTGSSARKLRREHANLLGGRALRLEVRPLTSAEINDRPGEAFDVERAILQRLIPTHYLSSNCKEKLRGYVSDYLVVDCKHLTTLREAGPIKHRILISFDKEPKTLTDAFGTIQVLPWQTFLARLWQGEFF